MPIVLEGRRHSTRHRYRSQTTVGEDVEARPLE